MLAKQPRLTGRDLIGLDGVFLGKEGRACLGRNCAPLPAVLPTVSGAWPTDALLRLVVLDRWQIFASERKVQSRRTFVSVC
jgi:hypothetical protein